ncbi:MAG: DUF4296 domain-containing protein [Bacteroidales bacterium]|nr:DUF4296 domain-containing protein [Bacteroidales bacterium]
MNFLKYPAFLVLLILFSCGNKQTSPETGILSEKKMVELIVDTHLVDAILSVENSRGEEKRDLGLFYYPSVLEKHGITKAQMDSSVSWYMKNPEAYTRIYEKVIKELDNRQSAISPADTLQQ